MKITLNRCRTHGLTNVLLQEDWEISEAYQVRGTPSAVLVGTDGSMSSAVAGGAEAIKTLLAYAAGERPQLPMQPQVGQGQPCPNCGKVHPNGNGSQQAMPAVVKVGELAPEVELPDLQGNIVGLEDFLQFMIIQGPGSSAPALSLAPIHPSA